MWFAVLVVVVLEVYHIVMLEGIFTVNCLIY